MTDATDTSRRELNKERTRASIRAATWTLATQRPLGEITAEQIAESAGVSRRTFFNYYAGVDAVMAEAIREPMLDMAATFLSRPRGEDPLTAIVAALGDQLPTDIVRWCVVLGPEQARNSEVYAQMWHLHAHWLISVLHQRLGDDADSFLVEGLSGSILSIFAATSRAWLERSHGRVDKESAVLFRELLVVGFDCARDGWRHTGDGALTPR
ncbi:MAG: TetR/AcrR family transcriptional regulator [Ornithinimicrobium sp.]